MILLEQTSPNGNVSAVVEEDGHSAHFYLAFHDADPDGVRLKACWVRNLGKAPPGPDVEPMRDGKPPMLPAAFCRHPEGGPPPARESLSLAWFEEGDAAALLEDGEILAILPAWAGLGDFPGYARDCVRASPLCWPFPPDRALFDRIGRAREYWDLWKEDSFWFTYRDTLLLPIEGALGQPHSQYFQINEGRWPPKALVSFELPDRIALLTLGVSVRPQPGVELAAEDPSPLRRFELAAAFDPSCPAEEVLGFARYLSAQASYPWVQGAWFGEGHSVPCEAVPEALGGRSFEAVLLSTHALDTPKLELPGFRRDPINVLWTVPITAAERDFAVEVGSDDLLDRLIAAGYGSVHRARPSVV